MIYAACLVVDGLLEDRHVDRVIGKYPGLDKETVEQAKSADPTGGGYIEWIAREIAAGRVVFPEDGEKVRSLLSRFNRLKAKPTFKGDRNVYAYATYAALARAVEAYGPTNRERVDVSVTSGIRKIGEHGPYTLFQVTTPEACTLLARHTQWCIKDPKFFYEYTKKGPLYIVVKDGEPYLACVPSRQQLRNVYDETASAEMVKPVASLLKKVVPPERDIERRIEQAPEATEKAIKYVIRMKKAQLAAQWDMDKKTLEDKLNKYAVSLRRIFGSVAYRFDIDDPSYLVLAELIHSATAG